VSPGRPGVFLDRDGVLNELVIDPDVGQAESPLRASDVRLIPGASAGAAALRGAGYVLVCVTNQPAAAKARVSLDEIDAIQQRVRELLSADGVQLDGWRMCPHHPDGVVAELSIRCACRKPAAGMLLDAARELDLDLSRSWMIGDSSSDIAAGRAAGCRTVLIENPASAHKRLGPPHWDLRAADLTDAAAQLLARGGAV
jgi:D-glycero-D-manno-heptose 1,7-bisphosphate phosphatase